MIRRLLWADLPALVDLERAASVLPFTQQALQEELAHVDAEVLGKFLHDGSPPSESLVGHLCLRRMLDEMWVLNIATHPDRRRCGVASALLVAAGQRAQSTSTSLWLEVREGNAAARALYERHGFDVVGRRPAYYDALTVGAKREAALLMTVLMPVLTTMLTTLLTTVRRDPAG